MQNQERRQGKETRPLKALAGAVLVIAVAAALILALPLRPDPTAAATPTPTATRTPIAKPTATPTPAPPPPPGPALGPGIMIAQCLSTAPNSVRVTFLWTPSRSGQQWLDLSVFNNGFAPGTFIGAGGFGQQVYGFIWPGLVQGTTHFARVNTLTNAGWMT